MTNDQISVAAEYFVVKRWCERAGVNYQTVRGALSRDSGSDYHTANPEWRSALLSQLRRDVEALAELCGLEVRKAKKGKRAA